MTLHLAVPLSLAFALTIGWFNGTIVEKTRLPSFIVTLGTFFVLIGAKLGFSKLFSGQVTVEGLNEAKGYDFWRKIFAASWIRNDHIWDDRDIVWTILVIAGVALIAAGVLEMSYRRASPRNAKGLIGFVASAPSSRSPASTGCSTATAWRRTSSTGPSSASESSSPCSDGVSWRFHPIGRRGPVRLDAAAANGSWIGVVLVVASVVLAAAFNPNSENAVGIAGLRRLLPEPVRDRARRIRACSPCWSPPERYPWRSPLVGIAIAAVPAVGLPDDPPGCASRDLRQPRRRRAALHDRRQHPRRRLTRPRPAWRSSCSPRSSSSGSPSSSAPSRRRRSSAPNCSR